MERWNAGGVHCVLTDGGLDPRRLVLYSHKDQATWRQPFMLPTCSHGVHVRARVPRFDRLIGLLPQLDRRHTTADIYEIAHSDHCILQGFDWPSWHDECALWTQPGAIASADMDTCRKVLTTYVRGERFCEGSLASRVASGAMAELVRRISTLVRTNADGRSEQALRRRFDALWPRIEELAGRGAGQGSEADVRWLRDNWDSFQREAYADSEKTFWSLDPAWRDRELDLIAREPDLLGPVGYQRDETMHTLVLAHLLHPRPDGTARVLEEVLCAILRSSTNAGERHPLSDSDLSKAVVTAAQKGAVNVEAERTQRLPGTKTVRRTDLWIEVATLDGLLIAVIENKIDAEVRKGQLEDYDRLIEARLRKADVHLPPLKAVLAPKSSRPETAGWASLSYEDLAVCMRKAMGPLEMSDPYVELYLRTVLRHLLGLRSAHQKSHHGRKLLCAYLKRILDE